MFSVYVDIGNVVRGVGDDYVNRVRSVSVGICVDNMDFVLGNM